jgi:hypothetical protein
VCRGRRLSDTLERKFFAKVSNRKSPNLWLCMPPVSLGTRQTALSSEWPSKPLDRSCLLDRLFALSLLALSRVWPGPCLGFFLVGLTFGLDGE